MAETDLVPAPDTAPPSPAGADIGSLLKPMTEGLADLQAEKGARSERIYSDTEKNLEHDQTQVARAYAATGVGPNELKPWDNAKQEEKYRTDPIEAFGSLGSVFGIVASAFTHAPMENALNASAAAIKATKEGNDEQRERAFKSWKENNDLVVKRHNMMRDSYADAVTLMKTNMAAGEARLSMEAARFGDKKVQFLLENGMSEELFKLIDSRNKAAVGMQDANNAITEDSMKKKIFEEQAKAIDENFKANPNDPNAGQMAAAHKLAAWQTIFGAGKQQPGMEILGRYIMEHPNATAEEISKFALENGVTHNYRQSSDEMLRSQLRNDLGREPTTDEFIDKKRQVTGVEDRSRAADERNRITDERNAEVSRHNQELEKINAGRGDVAKLRAEETARHNQKMEAIKEKGPAGNQNLTIQRQNAKAADEYANRLRDENKEMPEDEVQKKRAQHYAELNAASSSPSGNRLDDMQKRVDQIKYTEQDVDKVIAILKRHNYITGAGQIIGRPTESLSNVLGSNSTDWHEVESLLTQIKQREARIALDAQGRPLASEGGYTDKIVRGLNWGDTKVVTGKRLLELRKDLEQYRADTEKRKIGSSPSSGASPPPAEKPSGGAEKPWERDRRLQQKSEIEPDEVAA